MSTFNRANLIGESIRSITSQMGPDDEILIVDDGSTDETHEQVRAIHPPVRYLRQENLGKSAALNRALRESESTYVWICDDDDLLRPKVVPLLVDAIERTGADVVFGRYIRFRQQEGEKMYLGTGYWPDLSSGSLPRHILEDAFVMHNATLVRRSAYDRVGRFDEGMLRSQDYDMFVRLATTVTLAYVDAIIFDQRKHEGLRGPASVLHREGQVEKVWVEYDRRIFERVWKNLPIEF